MSISALKDKIADLDKKIIAGGALIMAAALFGAGTMTSAKSGHEAGKAREEAPVSVEALSIVPQTVDSVVSAAGSLSSRNTSVISSKVMGRVTMLSVNEGDHVTRGKLLMRIESGEITAQAYQAEAALNNARLHYERIKRLFDENAATRMEMDQATLGLESAKAGLNAAKAMESYIRITAPITGQIMEKKINVGEMALPGQPILKIEDNKYLRLDVTMKEQEIRFVEPGQPVTVGIDALPGKEIRGRVAQVVPASDLRTHSFIVKIDIPAEKGLITGMYGKAFFSTGKRTAVLVPRSAVIDKAGLSGVYIVSPGGNAIFQMVQFGEEHGKMVEALTGLKAGDQVVVTGQHGNIDGRKVIVAQN